jgi:hypothetical protein
MSPYGPIHRAVATLLVISAAAGCASYTPSTVSVPSIATAPAKITDDGVTVAADPWVQRDRQQSAFDADLADEDVIPVQVVVQNASGRPVWVRASDISLVVPDGRQVPTSSASSVAAKLQSSGRVIGWTVAFGVIGFLASATAEEQARNARVQDYRQKELTEARVEPQGSAHGFVFFILPKGTPPFDRADLVVRFVDLQQTAVRTAQLPLSGLASRAGRTAEAPAPPVAASVAAIMPTIGEPTIAPRTLLGRWSGTLTLPRNHATSTVGEVVPVTLWITDDAGTLRWRLDTGRPNLDATGIVTAVDEDIVLTGTFRERVAITFTVVPCGKTLEARGLGADQSLYDLRTQRME